MVHLVSLPRRLLVRSFAKVRGQRWKYVVAVCIRQSEGLRRVLNSRYTHSDFLLNAGFRVNTDYTRLP